LQNTIIQYVRLLEQLAEVMKMDAIVRKLGVEINGETLLARAEQLVRIEQEMLTKKNTQVRGGHTIHSPSSYKPCTIICVRQSASWRQKMLTSTCCARSLCPWKLTSR
jgi:hypothetical protein